jgi:hypothetical protein
MTKLAQHPGLAEELKAIDDMPMPTWTPPPRLTDELIKSIASTPCAIPGSYIHAFARAIETSVRKQFGAQE